MLSYDKKMGVFFYFISVKDLVLIMISDYTFDNQDKLFYEEHINPRLPKKIWDIHQHFALPEHVKIISKKMYDADWAIQCGVTMSAEEYEKFSSDIYKDREVYTTTFGCVLKGADNISLNKYVGSLVKSKRIASGLMVLDPSLSAEETAKMYDEYGFSGYKPYADMVAGEKAADVTFPEFMPDEHMKVLNDRKGFLMLHVPRAGRLPDDRNIRELRELRQKFPDITINIAHMGRCYCKKTFLDALEKLGSDVSGFHFDFAAVINPEVIYEALSRLDVNKIHYGTDLPVFWWHGRRQWSEESYQNLSREDFPWNKHSDAENEEKYTLFLYEQLKNMLDVIGQAPNAKELYEKIFYSNAKSIFIK